MAVHVGNSIISIPPSNSHDATSDHLLTIRKLARRDSSRSTTGPLISLSRIHSTTLQLIMTLAIFRARITFQVQILKTLFFAHPVQQHDSANMLSSPIVLLSSSASSGTRHISGNFFAFKYRSRKHSPDIVREYMKRENKGIC